MKQDYKFYVNGVEVKRATKFKLKRSFWQMIKDKIEFAKNKRRQKGSFSFNISQEDFNVIKDWFEEERENAKS